MSASKVVVIAGGLGGILLVERHVPSYYQRREKDGDVSSMFLLHEMSSSSEALTIQRHREMAEE